MARERADHSRGSAEPPSEVEITVLECERFALGQSRVVRGLVAHRVIALTAVAVALIAGLGVAVMAGGESAHHRSAVLTVRPMNAHLRLRARLPGPAGVAAAYGYPTRCLTVTIAADRAFARADFNHASLCGRFAGDPTAIFRRSRGAWRLVLDAVTYTCPVDLLPGIVQRQLAVCP